MWGAQGWNQWALQPAMFNDVPHEQIDWAALAKQWIQMQQTQPPDPAVPPLLPPVPNPTPSAAQLSIVPPPPPGHGPVVPEEFSSEVPVSGTLLKTPVTPSGLPEPFPTDQSFETESAGFVQKPVNNAYWNKSQWEASAAGDIDERVWTGPSIEPASTLIAGKETYDYGHMHDNPPLAMQSIDYNHMSEFSYNQVYPSENQYDQYWSQVNAAPPISPMFLKKEHTTATTATNASLPVEEDTSQIDAAKRKQLPAWIREGLEKMEQERIKKIEKEKSEKEKAEKLAQAKLKKDTDLKEDVAAFVPVKSKFDSDSDVDTEEVNVNTPKESVISKRSPSPIEDTRTEEEKRQEYMLNIRRILTEVLLTVTNAEMYAIAEEVIRKEQLKARQLASAASLTSVASGLRCLANYGSESEASDAEEDKEESDSDEELYRKIREKKKLFAIKEKKVIAELERKELEEQNEALKAKNEIISVNNESEPENNIKESERSISNEEVKPVAFIPPSDSLDQVCTIPFIEEKDVDNPNEGVDNTLANKELKKPINKDSHSSGSSSSSSGSESESSEKPKKKSDKNEHDRSKDSDRSKGLKKEKSPRKHHRHRSSDSDSSDHHRKSSRAYDKTSKKSSSYKKKKKYKRSDSSSSSSSSTRRRKYSSKSESSHNHNRERRSRSYEDRDRRRRSVSPKNYRSSRDSHRGRDSYSHRHEKDKYLKRDKDKYNYDYKRSPSPYRRSSKLPKKYRSSRSPSSESENSGRKTKKSRTR